MHAEGGNSIASVDLCGWRMGSAGPSALPTEILCSLTP